MDERTFALVLELIRFHGLQLSGAHVSLSLHTLTLMVRELAEDPALTEVQRSRLDSHILHLEVLTNKC